MNILSAAAVAKKSVVTAASWKSDCQL